MGGENGLDAATGPQVQRRAGRAADGELVQQAAGWIGPDRQIRGMRFETRRSGGNEVLLAGRRHHCRRQRSAIADEHIAFQKKRQDCWRHQGGGRLAGGRYIEKEPAQNQVLEWLLGALEHRRQGRRRCAMASLAATACFQVPRACNSLHGGTRAGALRLRAREAPCC